MFSDNNQIIGGIIMKRMYTFWCACLSLVLFLPLAFSQPAGYKDRLARVRDMVNSSELIVMWKGQQPNQLNQQIFDLDLTHPGGIDSTLVPKPLHLDSSLASSPTGKMSLATGNFLGGGLKNFVAAWGAPGDSVTLSIPNINSGTLSWNDAQRVSLPSLNSQGSNGEVQVVTGDFYGNRQDEFVLGFHGADSTIHLHLFSFDPGSLVPRPRGAINDEPYIQDNRFDRWEIVSGDFDGDGYHDVALLFLKQAGALVAMQAKIYTVDDLGNFVVKSTREVFSFSTMGVTSVDVAGAAGAFDDDPSMEIVFGCAIYHPSQTPRINTVVCLLDINNNLNAIDARDTIALARSYEPYFDIAAGDLNRNNFDELVFILGNRLFIYAVNDQFEFKLENHFDESGPFGFNRYLAIDDMDAERKSEIVVAGSYTGSIIVWTLDSSLTSFTTKANRLINNLVSDYTIALGDFDGDRIRLGEPVHFRRASVAQPTVILNTPPIHYDILDSTVLDLSGCYPALNCGFSSAYIQSTTFDTTVTTEINQDWGGDESITNKYGVYKEQITRTYGEKFSKSESSTSTMVVTTGRFAAGDDWLYANMYDIDFYEYPVYDGMDPTPLGYFVVSIPGNPRPLWIENKDDDILGNQFKVDHEVGNVLSYRKINTNDTSRVIVNFPEQTIGSTGNSFVSLEISSFRENGVDSSQEGSQIIGSDLDITASDPFGIFTVGTEIESNGYYNYGEIVTQTVRVGSSLEVRGDLGHLDPQFGTSGTYHVTPYAYWTRYGALVLDYKVSPLPMGGNSFWQARYGGKVDPAFSLPWRYDPEKGFSLPNNDPSYRMRTRDIAISKVNPRRGQTVTILARVRNLGLQNLTTPVPVRFYRNDPAAGGTQIGEAIIDSTILSRTSAIASIPWVIPLAESLQTVRIYAVIDPDNILTDEVHENNNKGWAPLVSLGAVTGVEASTELPGEFTLYQSYPNPFNPMATIRYDLPVASLVSIKVFNLLGQEIVTLANEVHAAGQNKVHFNGAGLPSGTYFYRMIATPVSNSGVRQIFTKKMVLIK